jgi:hypothetical protein
MKYILLLSLLLLSIACGKQESAAQPIKNDLPVGCSIDEASDLICNRSILNGPAGFQCWRLNCGEQRGKSLFLSECIHEGFADVCLK